jgi:hypothetical protein
MRQAFSFVLQQVGLWVAQKRAPLKSKSPPSEFYTDAQTPSYDNADPDYPFEAYK